MLSWIFTPEFMLPSLQGHSKAKNTPAAAAVPDIPAEEEEEEEDEDLFLPVIEDIKSVIRNISKDDEIPITEIPLDVSNHGNHVEINLWENPQIIFCCVYCPDPDPNRSQLPQLYSRHTISTVVIYFTYFYLAGLLIVHNK